MMCMATWNVVKEGKKLYCFHNARFTDAQEMHSALDYSNVMPGFFYLNEKFTCEIVTVSIYVPINNHFEICGQLSEVVIIKTITVKEPEKITDLEYNSDYDIGLMI